MHTLQNQAMNPLMNTHPKLHLKVLLVVAAIVTAALSVIGFDAMAAGQSGIGDSFEDFWLGVQSIATGAPGKSLMMMMVIMVIVFSTVKPNLVGFCGCIVSILVLANATTIIEAGLGATVADLNANVLDTLTMLGSAL